MALRATSDSAEDVAAGFSTFRQPLPEHATEITALIADLYAISSSLKSLDDSTNDRVYRRNLLLVESDLDLVRTSLKSTLDNIVQGFREITRRRAADPEEYRRTWRRIDAHFRQEAGYSLSTGLDIYKRFLGQLDYWMRDHPPDLPLIDDLRRRITLLCNEQDNGWSTRFASSMNFNGTDRADRAGRANTFGSMRADRGSPPSPDPDRRPRNRRSYERTRPNNPPQSPQSPLSPSSGTTFSDIPPSAPDAPGSSWTGSTTSQSGVGMDLSDHWARKVFSGEHSATRIPPTGESSKCFGDPKPGAKRWLHEELFEELLHLAFNGESELHVSFYVRDVDNRARILCKVPHPRRPSDYFCLPLNMLEIVRSGSCLQLCRRRHSRNELILWANVKFNTIEKMVLFFCTFLALRSQDSGFPLDHIPDCELEHEEELFGGQIIDDSYLHALRVYRDTVSKVVRLQASVHKGEMKRAPVWTAFITHHINSRAWIRQVDAKTIHLRELQRTVFTFSDYTPPRTQRGEHILKFKTPEDANSFMDTIEDLASRRL